VPLVVLTVVFVGGALWALWKPSVSLELWALLLMRAAVHRANDVDGTVLRGGGAGVRGAGAAEPTPHAHKALTILMPMAQALLFFMWCLFYWVA
jgi:hypothetical protein